MLKRQRPSSPSPASFPSAESFTESTPDAKRRRVLPPTLDGKLRGWETPRYCHHSDCDDDDNFEEIDGEEDASGYSSASTVLNDSLYKSTNDFLHQLHALQRHRLLFTQPQAGTPKTDCPRPLPYPQSAPTHPSSQWQANSTRDLNHMRSPTSMEAGVDHSTHAERAEHNDETQLVRDRYEDTNRMLGSLFLSRRRELGDNER
ncbi:hypothetical protein Moror_180 [Moniliophthora roreri MCA 2997]|uniref:Uncharacterized protein n=1 Tax=Moniliophthora roreri (strain MCA 2997) TaxID=1381753 RepID=V2Y0Z1_MONRO|nr:hypothetical protein Moror_180 [Moniliophthora roreri MCA 2997]